MADERPLVSRIWEGESAADRLTRMALAPLGLGFRGLVSARARLYDAGILRVHDTPIPALSIGNLTVGGTGKTPFAAWMAGQLGAQGSRPAIVLRGYGADEVLVHRLLNPGMPVIAGADRRASLARAAREGADVAVLDDAFQRRRVRRAADVVLVSADRWTGTVRLLPAGPWREPLSALERASLVIITRKAAEDTRVEQLFAAVGRAAPSVPVAVVRLALGGLERVGAPSAAEPASPATLDGASVLAVAAIGDPAAFVAQLRAAGAQVTTALFPDHHAFGADREVAALVARARGADLVVCTLKDAVKLGPCWPRVGPPLWYVSQHLVVEQGGAAIAMVADTVLRARTFNHRDAGVVPAP